MTKETDRKALIVNCIKIIANCKISCYVNLVKKKSNILRKEKPLYCVASVAIILPIGKRQCKTLEEKAKYWEQCYESLLEETSVIVK